MQAKKSFFSQSLPQGVYLIGLLLLLCLQEQTAWTQRPGWWHLTDEDGLPGMTVHEMVEDEQGFIWMGTSNGLCRFDGRTFHVFSDLELKDNEILKLKKDRFGRLWLLNLANELVCFEKDSLGQGRLKPVISLEQVQALWLSDDGLIIMEYANDKSKYTYYSFTSDGAIVEQSSLTTPISQAHFNAIPQMVEGHFSLIILHHKKQYHYVQLIQVVDHQLLLKEHTFDEKKKKVQVDFLAPIQELYITSGNVVALIKDSQLQFLHEPINVFYRLIYQSEKMGAWIKEAKKEMFSVRMKKGLPVFRDEGLFLNVNSLMQDREGNFWIGTTGDGIYLIPSFDIQYFNTYNKKIPTDYVYFIHPDKEKILVGQTEGHLTIFEEEQATKTAHFAENGDLRTIAIDQDRQLLMGLDRSIIYTDFQQLEKDKIYFSNITGVKELFLDHDSQFYVASSVGVWKINGPRDRIPAKSQRELILDKRTYGLCKDHKDRLWMGTTNGLYYQEGDQIKIFDGGENMESISITDLHYAADSSIWVATDNRGLLRIKNDQVIEQYTTAEGLTSNNCIAICDDGRQIWLGTNLGLNVIDPPKKTIQSINVKAGLPSNEVNAIHVDGEQVWVGTPNGLALFPKSIMERKPPPPLILLSKIAVNGKEKPMQEHYDLRYDENDLAISYTGLAYQTKGKEQYYYRMLGLDTTWQVSTNRDVSYYALAPGQYTFEVHSVSLKEVRSEQAAQVHFYIAPAWWQIWWVQLLLGLLLLTLVATLTFWRQQNILKNERKENQLQERISELRMQALQSQMNPHFVFNTLNAIQELLLTNDIDKAMDALSHFAKMIAFVFENSQKKTISLGEEIQFLRHYLNLEKLRFEERVDIEFKIDPTLEDQKEELRIPPLLLQPLIENAFKHGLHHRLEKGRLLVEFMPDQQFTLKCSIIDNGVGRKVAAGFSPLHNKRKRSISSLDITRERLNLFHQSTTDQEYLRIVDVLNQKNQVKGTKVEVWL